MIIRIKRILLTLFLTLISTALIYLLVSNFSKKETRQFDATFIKKIEEGYNENNHICKSRENDFT